MDTTHAAQQKAWMKDVSTTFQKSTGAKVVFETYASSDDEMKRIQTAVASGQGPDVYQLGTTFTPLAASTGAFMTLDDAAWKTLGGKGRFVQGDLAMSGATPSTEVGVPVHSRPYVLAYNKKMFAAAGIANPPTSWDEFAADAKRLTDPAAGVYGAAVGFADSYDTWKYIWAMSMQAGNPLVKDNKAVFDDPVVATAYRTFFDWYTKDKIVDPKSYSWTGTEAVAAFAAGKAAMIPLTGSSMSVTFNQGAVKNDWAYAQIPSIAPGMTKNPANGKPAGSIISGDNLVVANYSPNEDLALKLVKQLTEPKEQAAYYKIFGDLPTTTEGLKEVSGNDPNMQAVAKSAENSLGTPFVGAWSDIQLALENIAVQAQSDLAAGNVPDSYISSALKDAASKAQDSLDRAKKS